MSKKKEKVTTEPVDERNWHKWDYFNLAVQRCNAVSAKEIPEEMICSIQTAYFDKKLSLDDLVDVFSIPKIILNLLIAEPDEYEQEKWDSIEPYSAPPAV